MPDRTRRRPVRWLTAAAVGCAATWSLAGTAFAAAPNTQSVREISRGATVMPRQGTAPAAGPFGPEISPIAFGEESDGGENARRSSAAARQSLGVDRSRSARPRSGRALAAAQTRGRRVLGGQGDGGLQLSFDGITSFQQRSANNGNQWTTEPPDQGLCVGNGYVLESVNTALRVFDRSGKALTPVVDLNTFYGYPAAIQRTDPPVYGPFLTDPVCHYDPQTKRFYHVVLTLGADPVTGDLTSTNQLDIAVSKTGDPTGEWNLYRLDVTNDGQNGTPKHDLCPCIGDYPQIGADAHGLYITTNEYPFAEEDAFNGAQIYAFSKRALARGDAKIRVVQFENTQVEGTKEPGFTVQPAVSPGTRDFATTRKGTEYFLSSRAAEETGNETHAASSLVVWALSGTSTLDAKTPRLRLRNAVVGTEAYSVPPLAEQKDGPAPLRDFVNANGFGDPTAPPQEVLGKLDALDSRVMQHVNWAHGKLWGTLDTTVTVAGKQQAGIAWFIVRPRQSYRTGRPRPRVYRQGYLSVAGNNVIIPAPAILSSGRGAMGFTLVGPDYYPSAAYATWTEHGVGPVQVAGPGAGPQDGFSEYNYFSAPDPARPRWGDYGGAVAEGNTIWLASEYIGQVCTFEQYVADPTCGSTRAPLANWYTRISRVTP